MENPDWQTWAALVIVGLTLVIMIRRFRSGGKNGSCPSCPADKGNDKSCH